METQESVTAWCEEHYPGESRNDMLKVLLEEVTELCVAMGDISREEISAVIDRTWNSLAHDRGNAAHVSSGLADIQIALYMLGSKTGLSVEKALADKMAVNRKRSS